MIVYVTTASQKNYPLFLIYRLSRRNTNYVMFDIGQPLHAFDAGKLKKQEAYAISIRMARKGESMITLEDKEYAFSDAMMVITDAHADATIGIAGIKGGKTSGVDEKTKDIILEAANFE